MPSVTTQGIGAAASAIAQQPTQRNDVRQQPANSAQLAQTSQAAAQRGAQDLKTGPERRGVQRVQPRVEPQFEPQEHGEAEGETETIEQQEDPSKPKRLVDLKA